MNLANTGITCRKCGCNHLFVIYTRSRPGFIMRRRECRNCGHRFVTYEKVPACVHQQAFHGQ